MVSAKTIIENPEKENPESIFFDKNVSVTGKLSSMTRVEAFQMVTSPTSPYSVKKIQ